MMNNRFITFVVIVCAMTGCRQSPASYMAFDDVTYVHSVKNSIKLEHGETVEIDKIGIQDIFISDSLLFVSSPDADGLISVYELPDMEYYGKFFCKGNGPGELLNAPFFGSVKVLDTESGKNMLIGDGKGKMLSWEISSPFQDRSHDVVVSGIRFLLNPFIRYTSTIPLLCAGTSAAMPAVRNAIF